MEQPEVVQEEVVVVLCSRCSSAGVKWPAVPLMCQYQRLQSISWFKRSCSRSLTILKSRRLITSAKEKQN